MNAITTVENVSAATLEHVLGTGDLSKLSPAQKVEYMLQACKLIGLNPLTRPFRFMTFQGQTTMYATRDCADQLRKLHKISLTIVDKQIDSEIYTVTARARMPDGREDEDMGAVPFGKAIAGEFRANAILKAITKAKRRVTLSICGLGFLDETEVETLEPQGARTFDAEEAQPQPATQQPVKKRTFAVLLDELEVRFHDAQTTEDVEAVVASDECRYVRQHGTNGTATRLEALITQAYERLQAAADDAAGAAIEEPEMSLP